MDGSQLALALLGLQRPDMDVGARGRRKAYKLDASARNTDRFVEGTLSFDGAKIEGHVSLTGRLGVTV